MRSSTEKKTIGLLVFICWVMLHLTASGDEPPRNKNDIKTATKTIITTRPVGYTPAPGRNGAPRKRITVGAPRGSSTDIELSLFIPEDHIVTSNQPTLQWEISRAVDKPVKFMLVTDDLTEPVIEIIIKPAISGGIHTINFTDLDLSLVTHTEYEWSMQICKDISCKSTEPDLNVRTFIVFN